MSKGVCFYTVGVGYQKVWGDLCKSWGTGVAGGVPSHSGGAGYGGVSHTSNLIRPLLYPIRELYQFGT
jgi:hypothetical protein